MALDYVGLGLAVLLLGARAGYRRFFSASARVRRELAEIPRSHIGPGLTGVVHVAGQVRRLEHLLQSPLGQLPCVAYELEVDVREGRRWERLITRHDARPFLLADESGQVLTIPAPTSSRRCSWSGTAQSMVRHL